MDDREQQLREQAYRLWQAEGEPHGRDREHWEAAERSLAPTDAAPAADADATAREAAPASEDRQPGAGDTPESAPTGEDRQPGGTAPDTTAPETPPAAASAGHALDAAPAAPPPAGKKPAKPRTPRGKAKPAR